MRGVPRAATTTTATAASICTHQAVRQCTRRPLAPPRPSSPQVHPRPRTHARVHTRTQSPHTCICARTHARPYARVCAHARSPAPTHLPTHPPTPRPPTCPASTWPSSAARAAWAPPPPPPSWPRSRASRSLGLGIIYDQQQPLAALLPLMIAMFVGGVGHGGLAHARRVRRGSGPPA